MEQIATNDDNGSEAAPPETNRARVRRLFIDPLTRDGMRFEHVTKPEAKRRKLDQMADDLGYLSDESLRVLAACMRTKGEGAKKVFWPSRVSILGFAETRHHRPLQDVPGLQSWFVSAAGRTAASVPGRLVAEHGFWKKHKRPPMTDLEWKHIHQVAADYARRVELIDDRIARDVLVTDEELDWHRRYRETEEMLRGWLAEAGA
tara:strand:- start:47988 stop:48599 length:612 start_codon:yes stop_codon:yes gene_type:complete